MEYAIKSDIGRVRDNNEDTVFTDPGKKIFVICDGFGEGSYGKIASSISSQTVNRYFESSGSAHGKIALDIGVGRDGEELVSAIQLANLRLYNFVDKFIDYYGMGSTIASLYIRDGCAYVGHVGDSRVYLFRDNAIQLLTVDHSYVNELIKMGRIKEEEAHRYVNKHFITRSLGMSETIRIDLNIQDVKKNDVFLLCSDGLNHMVSDIEIESLIRKSMSDLDGLCKTLVKRANELGGEDDISIVALRIAGDHGTPKDSAIKKGITYIPDMGPDIVKQQNSLLEKIFGEELYPKEIKVS